MCRVDEGASTGDLGQTVRVEQRGEALVDLVLEARQIVRLRQRASVLRVGMNQNAGVGVMRVAAPVGVQVFEFQRRHGAEQRALMNSLRIGQSAVDIEHQNAVFFETRLHG
ncbi:hypothetical protein [Pandoraea sp. XY-2]|uniref:hypothetical protein n=1 Tax=Pandoraea sp. XY-2 TaxID=2518599 RepID=UPI00101AF5DD|nr:hypothetical protein [Pandoraea sp. XY-2]QBC33384.1 hypothetical protein DRB87_21450 [Pandoraea sp. XY-2]